MPGDIDAAACSPREVWTQTVDLAIDREVDAVIVTGDIVDEENEYIEAYGAFEQEVSRLDEAGIPTLVVSGNHDWNLVPDMIDDIGLDTVHLLGRNGTWSRHTIEGSDGTTVHIDGWSFPSKHVVQSPLESYSLNTDGDTPVLGMAHVDLNATDSQYAPVSTAELRDSGTDAWLLGHIHVPRRRVENDPLVLYPGSPQGLDPGERGAHGPWEVTVGGSTDVAATQRPLATLQYDTLSIDASAVEAPADLPGIVSQQAQDHVDTEIDTDIVDYLVLELTLTGRTPAHTALQDYRTDLRDFSRRIDGVEVTVRGVSIHTRPDIDLEALADNDDPAGYLAALLLSLRDGSVEDTHPDLVSDTTETLKTAHNADTYRELRRERDEFTRPTTDEAVGKLERQAEILLDKLVQQMEGDA